MSCKILSARSVINRTAYGGANLVPIAVPLNSFINFFVQLKDLCP